MTTLSAAGGPPRSSLDRMLAALDAAGVRYQHRGDHIQAECPTHSDKTPSLSIDYKASDGKTVFRCHGGCDGEDVAGALELTWPMLHDDYLPPEEFAERRRQERTEEARTGKKPRPAAKRKPVEKAKRPTLPKGRMPKRLTEPVVHPVAGWVATTTYDYTDLEGTVIHQEVRHQRSVTTQVGDVVAGESTEKRFTQRWPDGQGGWREKTPAGFEPVLYRLPDLVGWIAEGRRIWLCEGAKDAERFLQLGEAATTNPSGAGNFKDSQAAALAGAHVTAVLDHDLAGYRRGIKLSEQLDKAASLRLVLPVTTGRHEDASDHFDAGHGLEDFVEVSVEQLRGLERVAAAEEAARAGKTAASEAQARAELANAGGAKVEDERRFAARWAAETGKHLVKAWESLHAGEVDDDQAERMRGAVRSCQDSVTVAHGVAGISVPDELQQYLEEPEELEDEPSNVVELHQRSGGDTWPRPSTMLAYANRMHWAYEVGGEGRRPRGVYCSPTGGDARWDKIADLPYVHARVVQRDGSGKPTGTFYLVSAESGSEIVMIGPDETRSHSWTNLLNMPVFPDPKYLQAATGALEHHAKSAELREATPRLGKDGKIQLPFEMPLGYLRASENSRADALATWAEIAELVAENPKMALVLGASAVSPFIGGLGNQPHVVSLYGRARVGKTTALDACAAIWGPPQGASEEGGAGIRLSWNSTSLSVPAFLGSLSCLPAFMDEIGQAGDMKDAQWHQLISNITQGAVRMTRKPRSPGVQLGLTWKGIFFSTGNGTMGTDAVGRNAGIPRRMVELQAPFTNSKAHGQAIERRTRTTYGHVGLEILDRHSLTTVRALIARAHEAMGGNYGEGHQDAMAEHLAAHLAGAMMLDDLLGTGDVLFNSALLAAGEFLDECAPPPSDADQLLAEITEWMAREPGAWPSREQYDALMRPKSIEGEQVLAAHGFKSELAGYREGNSVYFTSAAMKRMVDALGIERKVALQELYDRGLLQIQESRRRRGEWLTQNRVMGCSAYVVALPDLDDEGTLADPINSPDSGPVGGSHTPNVGGVGGAVGGANNALTSTVGGVGGVGGPLAHMRVREGDIHFPGSEATPETEPPTPAGEVLTKLETATACTVCGEPTRYAVDGVPVHPGADCAEKLPPAEAPDQPEAGPARAETAPPTAQKGPAQRRSTQVREARFTAPAACLDAEGVHLADGTALPFPEINHIGDLALLTGREQLRLGWGGGEDRLPDQGQIWLYPAALERLGFPTEMPLPAKALTKSQRAKETQKLFSKLDDHPLVAGALEAGWQLGQGGHMDVWTRIWHPELLPAGALLVGLPWHRIEGVALFEDNPTPAELARRLLLFAKHVGVSYRITSAATGLDLIDHHRPPRRSIDDDKGASRGRVALIRNTAAELPGWRANSKDARFAGLEQDFSWWRAWDSLPESERSRRYVHGYDRNASYLVPWRSIDLGVEDLIHRTGDAAAWDGKEKPGYYLVDANYEWPSWGLPDPGTAAGARVGGGKMWVTVHTLKQLKAHGITPRVHESYTWSVTTRYLEGPGTALRDARMALIDSQDAGERAVLATIKALYSATVGKLAEREHYADFHLWRPDWRDHVISATRTAILYTVTKAQEISGEHPLVVDRDAVFYASDNPDPIAAWPGDPAKLGTALGSWKPIGTADLQTWGPEHLPKRSGRWHYAEAVDALEVK